MSTQVGLTGAVWGTVGDSEIIVDNISESKQGERETMPDGDGRIVAASYYGDVHEISMDFRLKDGAAASYLLARGAAISLPTGETDIGSGASTIYLDTWEKNKSIGAWLAGSLTAHYYPDMS